jgi:hypothetical protein
MILPGRGNGPSLPVHHPTHTRAGARAHDHQAGDPVPVREGGAHENRAALRDSGKDGPLLSQPDGS